MRIFIICANNMAYKVLIVDDEKIIRMGLQVIIPWKELGVDELFAAANASEALQILKTEKPDIILTDICMSGMTGIELITEIKKMKLDIKIVILTGYDNFEYAQQCCKLQVEDFLLKPADEVQLENTIKTIVAQLDEAKNIAQNSKTLNRATGVSEQLKIEMNMRDLVHARTKVSEIDNLFIEFNYDKKQPIQVAIIVPTIFDEDKWKNDSDLFVMSIKNICIQIFDSTSQGITFVDDNNHVVIALFDDPKFDETVERIENLNEILKDECGVEQHIVIGSLVKGFNEIVVSYNDATYLLNQENNEIDQIVQSNNSQKRLDIFWDIFEELKHIMTFNIGDEGKIFKAYDSFQKATVSYNLSQSLVCRCCFNIASSVYFSYIVQTRDSVDNRLTALLDSLVNANRDDACRLTKDFITNMLSSEEENTHEIVSEAKRYIKENLSDDLSVSNIANKLYITPNYFSRLFKKITDEGCNEYIVRKRIEKAKMLLESTSIKTGKIALMVGYRDTNYFSLAFKKHTGSSPTGYRENIRGFEN